MFDAQLPPEFDRPPMPDMPPIRTFEVTTANNAEGIDVIDVIEAHSIEFTVAGGIYFTRLTPDWVEMNGEKGWTVIKRIVAGWSAYISYREMFTVPSPLVLN